MLRFIIVSVGLSGLIITVVSVNIWTRTEGESIHRWNIHKPEVKINTVETKLDPFLSFQGTKHRWMETWWVWNWFIKCVFRFWWLNCELCSVWTHLPSATRKCRAFSWLSCVVVFHRSIMMKMKMMVRWTMKMLESLLSQSDFTDQQLLFTCDRQTTESWDHFKILDDWKCFYLSVWQMCFCTKLFLCQSALDKDTQVFDLILTSGFLKCL